MVFRLTGDDTQIYLTKDNWYNRKGTIRAKDVKRYQQIKKRYARDLKYYKANIERIRKEYAEARSELTSLEYWKNYLKME